MKLPKRDLPEYRVNLPVSGAETVIRPYTVKEERILSMAASNPDPKSAKEAMRQVVENCTSAKFSELCDADFEWLYIKLVAISVSNVSSVSVKYECEKEDCPKEHPTAVNLDHVYIDGLQDVLSTGAFRKNDYWVIQFDENSGVCLRLRLSEDSAEETLYNCTVNVFDENGVYDEFTKEELIDYFECLQPKEFEKVKEFMKSQPYCAINVDGRCRQCGKSLEVKTKGVLDFLE
jgi:hypothetical protein